MPDIEQFCLPALGEKVVEAEVVRWRVQAGDPVQVGAVLVAVESDKALVHVPSPFTGTVAQILAPERTAVTVGAPLATVDVDRAATAAAEAAGPPPTKRRRPLADRLVGVSGTEEHSA